MSDIEFLKTIYTVLLYQKTILIDLKVNCGDFFLCALCKQFKAILYKKVLAPSAKMRSVIIPGLTRAQIKEKEKQENKDSDESISIKKSSPAKILARVFEIDISKCVHYNGKMKIISSIKEPIVIKKILTHLGLSPSLLL